MLHVKAGKDIKWKKTVSDVSDKVSTHGSIDLYTKLQKVKCSLEIRE